MKILDGQKGKRCDEAEYLTYTHKRCPACKAVKAVSLFYRKNTQTAPPQKNFAMRGCENGDERIRAPRLAPTKGNASSKSTGSRPTKLKRCRLPKAGAALSVSAR